MSEVSRTTNLSKPEQRFTQEFDLWIEETGAIEKDTGWYWEARSIVVDADTEIEKLREALAVLRSTTVETTTVSSTGESK